MNILAMQKKLQYKAINSSQTAFYKLYNFIEQPDWLKEACNSVAQNSGADTPGIDGVTMTDLKAKLSTTLETLSELLAEGRYKPQPYRRVSIPKSNGGERLLNIPTITDRIVQEAIRMAIEPIFEADFSAHSYAYRQNMSIHDALSHLVQGSHKRPWVVEGDIKDCFDTINHDTLLTLLRRRINDSRLIHLIRLMLKAGVLDKNRFYKTHKGVPQGAVISPLLSNIYLHELDVFVNAGYMEEAKQPLEYVRFADDFVALCSSKTQAEGVYNALRGFLASRLQLTLSSDKTLITQFSKGIDFLGFHIKQNGIFLNPQVQVLIPITTVKEAKEQLEYMTSEKTYYQDLPTKIRQLNYWLRGWCNTYKRANNAGATFVKVENFLHERLSTWLAGKYRVRLSVVKKRFFKGKTFATGSQKLLLPSQVLRSTKILPYSFEDIESEAA